MENYYEPLEMDQLIAEVKRRPVIWNSNLEDYNDRVKKKQAWQEVLKMCTAGWETMSPFTKQEKAKEIQKRWKNVRDHYVRELKIIHEGVVRKKRKYLYFDRLSFLGTLHQNKITSTTPRFKSSLMHGEESKQASVAALAQEEYSNGEDTLYDGRLLGDAPFAERGNSLEGGDEGKSGREVKAAAVPPSSPERAEGGGGCEAAAAPKTFPPWEEERANDGMSSGESRGRAVSRFDFKANLLEILKSSVVCRAEQSGDEDRLFMLSLVSELKRVPVGRRLLVKTQIIQAILQGQQSSRDPSASR
ncbi:uncharacterized protein [Hetaerina americana]|uniref:uncharacterized protein n=1 Tax=Hetaerina americana TaxID=62018 RepID=UPI003A7F349C